MKKFLIIILLSICPIIVLADAAGPSIIGYDAVISNKNGVKVTDHDDEGNEHQKTITYNTKVHVIGEEDGNVTFCLEYENGTCNSTEYETKASNITVVEKEVTPDDFKNIRDGEVSLEKENNKLFVSNKNGVKLKKGPADIYEEYSETIPYKEIINSTYIITSFHRDNWYYVNNGTYKGWIKKGVSLNVNQKIMAYKDIKLYNVDTDSVIATIPSETIINNYYDSHAGLSDSTISKMNDYGFLYVDYEGQFGYIKDGFADELESYSMLLVLKNTEMKSKGKTITSIPKGEEIKALYYGGDAYYAEYNNNKGFVSDDDVAYFIREGTNPDDYGDNDGVYASYFKEYSEDKDIYEISLRESDAYELDVSKTKIGEYIKQYKTNKVVPAKTKVKVYGIESLYEYTGRRYYLKLIKYNDTIGLIIDEIDESNMYDEYKENNKEKNLENDKEKETEINTETDSEDVIAVPKDKKNGNKTNMLIIYCVAGAVILSLTTIVIIKLINRKKKQDKVEPTKEESKVNVEEPKNEEIPIEPQKKEENEEKEKKE